MSLRVAAYQPDIAANLGAMVRICACFEAGLDVIEPCGFPYSDKAMRRAAMDYADKVDVIRHDSWDHFARGARAGRLVLLTTRADTPHWQFGFRPDDTLLVGRESAGVPDHVHDAAHARITIPMPGGGRSLNVAVSAGIVLSEVRRQLDQ